MKFQTKEKYDVQDLLEIMKILRSPGGCPWDAEQDHKSIRSNLIEESYEVLEAIDNQDTDGLKEELGDILMQVVFHARMEEEKGNFDFGDVADGVCKKLIYRHPHVFGNVKAENTSEVLRNWDALKRVEKAQKGQTDSMRSIAKGLPALIRAAKVQQKAARVGFDWEKIDGALDKVEEELAEVRKAMDENDAAACGEELGDLLFSVVNVSRFLNVDAEQSLNAACEKFISRFALVEELAAQQGIDMQNAGLSVLDQLWEEAKARLSGK